jgi:hypothetical protein
MCGVEFPLGHIGRARTRPEPVPTLLVERNERIAGEDGQDGPSMRVQRCPGDTTPAPTHRDQGGTTPFMRA